MTFTIFQFPLIASVTLVFPEEKREVSIVHAITKCSLFQNPSLAVSPSNIRSSVAPRSFGSSFPSWSATRSK
jgi:hypothetical protein